MQRLHPYWASHMPLLVRAAQVTTGPVLELGMGVYSTPLLHMLCFDKDRKLVSYENDAKYVEMLKKFRTKDHEINLVEDWDSIEDSIKATHWGFVFVDHKPAERRIVDIKKLTDNAEFVIIHDSEDPAYHYEEIFPLFKYRFDYTKIFHHTAALSNKREFVYED
jgi:hypothetical protein